MDHIHILGICGTFMGGVALLAREAGYRVTGSDESVYPPMSTQLERLGITLHQGYDAGVLQPAPERVLVGNVLGRGNPAVEFLLDRDLPFDSGPAWLAEHVLRGRTVIAVAGTHGKTTTASMIAWILDRAGLEPGFLIGGVPTDFGLSARLGRGAPFVDEADEYDTAFFDKRAKFVHYRPRLAVLNNLEFDHADIYPDLGAIERQFHHFVRTIPGHGMILVNADSSALQRVLDMGCWTPLERFGQDGQGDWTVRDVALDGSEATIARRDGTDCRLRWSLAGRHNLANAVAAVAVCHAAGVPVADACTALGTFSGVRRRLEVLGDAGGVCVYDDFAHHPTAIAASVAALRSRAPEGRIVALLEPRSNTMRMGVHRDRLALALEGVDRALLLEPPGLAWDLAGSLSGLGRRASVHRDVDALLEAALGVLRPGDSALVMSNGGFGGVHRRLLARLRERAREGT